MKLRILNIHFSKVLGGIEQAFLDYTEILQKHGHEVACVVDPRSPFIEALAHTGASVHTLSNHGNYDIFAALRLSRLVRRFQPDIALGHSGRSYSLLKMSMRGRVPLVGVKHNDNIKHLNGLDYVLCVNSYIQKLLVASGRSPETVAVIHNMVDINPEDVPQKRPFQEPLVFGAIGRFCEQKGFDILLHALYILKDRNPELAWRLHLAGSGEMEATLRTLVRTYGLNEHVKFLGWISDKTTFYSGIDIFILPSRDEPFGIVLLEAMKHSVPVVATRSHGPLDIIEDGEHGLLVEKENPTQLAQKLLDLINFPDRGRAMMMEAFFLVRDRFSRAVVGEHLNKLLTQFSSHRNHRQNYSE